MARLIMRAVSESPIAMNRAAAADSSTDGTSVRGCRAPT